tara:strand:- start:576 stop:833 length:258 start_codon:yes stop_codon:yes gene_type:complete
MTIATSTRPMTMKRKILNYLMTGKGLTSNEASSRFNCGNFRATISSIKDQVEAYGNWRVVTEEASNGKTRYFLKAVALVDPSYND